MSRQTFLVFVDSRDDNDSAVVVLIAARLLLIRRSARELELVDDGASVDDRSNVDLTVCQRA